MAKDIKAGGISTALAARKKRDSLQHAEIEKYDFRHPKLVSKEIMQALHRIHNMFARNVKRIFTNGLNLEARVMLEDIEQVVVAEFLNKFNSPTALFLFDIEEFEDWAVLQMDPSFCIFFVEYQSGGRSVELPEPRSLSRIEERVMGRTINKLFGELTQIWAPYLDMNIADYVYESKPANVRTVSYGTGISVTFSLTIEQLTIPFSICYPYTLLKEKMKNSFEKLNSNSKKKTLSSDESIQFEKKLKDINVTARAMLGKSRLTFKELLNLKEGDSIKLNQHINEPLRILVNKELKMYGYPGTKSGNKAIKIFDILDKEL